MRLRFLLSVVALLAAAGHAGAGSTQRRLPKPISLIDDRVERSAGATQGVLATHPPAKYSGPDWGSRFDQIKYNYPPRPLTPRLKRPEY
jgi:hypothetical protein